MYRPLGEVACPQGAVTQSAVATVGGVWTLGSKMPASVGEQAGVTCWCPRVWAWVAQHRLWAGHGKFPSAAVSDVVFLFYRRGS